MYIHKRDQKERERERERENLKYLKRVSLGDGEEGALHTALVFLNAVQIAWAGRVCQTISPLSVSPAFTFDFVIFCSVYMCVCILSCCHIELCMYTVYMPIADVYTIKRLGRELTRSLAIRGHIVWCLHTTADRPYTFNR